MFIPLLSTYFQTNPSWLSLLRSGVSTCVKVMQHLEWDPWTPVRRAVLLISVYDPESAAVCLPVWQRCASYTVVRQVGKPKAENLIPTRTSKTNVLSGLFFHVFAFWVFLWFLVFWFFFLYLTPSPCPFRVSSWLCLLKTKQGKISSGTGNTGTQDSTRPNKDALT